MHRHSCPHLGLLILAVSLSAADALQSAGAESHSFRAGAHAVDISPTQLPVLVNGGFFSVTGTRVVDPLYARWLVLADGREEIAIGVIDSCVIPRDLADQAKDAVSAATGIRSDRILLSVTHTHSAPSLMQAHGTDRDPTYPEYLIPLLAQGAAQAKRNLAPARAGWTSIQADSHTHCRRWIRRPDRLFDDPFGQPTVRANMHPGHCNPDAIGPSGPTDPDLTLLAIETVDGRPIALLANYSMHYFGAPAVSSDYFGRFAEKIAQRLVSGNDAHDGPPVVGIMSQGTSGDLQWMDYGQPRRAIDYDAYAEELAQLAHQAYGSIAFRNDLTLDMLDRDLELDMRVPDAERLRWADGVMREFDGFNGGRPTSLPQLYAREQFFLAEHPRRPVKLQALRIGDLGIAAISAEVYGITGLKLKLQSPFETQMNFSLANGEDGYIPPPEQHVLGGYTTWEARTAGLEVDAEPKMVAALLDMLEQVAERPRRAIPAADGPYVRSVLSAEPVAYWQLEEIDGTVAIDRTGGGHHGVFQGGYALYLSGPSSEAFSEAEASINRCVHFAGGYMEAQLPEVGPEYSVEGWFWNGLPCDARDVTGTLLVLDHQGYHSRLIITGQAEAASGTLAWVNSSGPPREITTGTTRLRPQAWHHVVVVRESGRTQVFLNGNPTPEIVTSQAPTDSARSLNTLRIAGDETANESLEGRADEVAVYPRALSSDEIVEHFRQSLMPVPAPLPRPQPPSTLVDKPRRAAYHDAVLRLKPLAYWPLHSGPADVTGHDAPADFEEQAGVATAQAEDAFRGGRLHTQLAALGTTWSVSFWFCSSLPNDQRPVTAYLVSRGPDGAEGAPGDHLGVGGTHAATGRLFVFNGNQLNQLVQGVTPIAPGTWNHVVLVRDGSDVRAYLNGHTAPELEGHLQVAEEGSSAHVFFAGRNDRFAPLQGAIEDISVHGNALTGDAAAELFRAATQEPVARLPRGHVFFATDFEQPDVAFTWPAPARIVKEDDGNRVLYVARSADAQQGSATVQVPLPVEQIRGHIVHFAARVRAEEISSKPQPWNGVKFMAPWTTAADEPQWPSVHLEDGSFGWRTVAFRVAVPPDAKSMSLVLGLEQVTGQVWFDDIQVSVHRPLPTQRAPVTQGPAYKGHDLPRLRGAMVGPEIDEEGLRTFGQEWNANLIRWQLIRRGRIADPLDMQAYRQWLHGALEQLDAALPACERYGLKVVLDLHSPPGGRTTEGGYAGSDHGLFTHAECQEEFVAVWREIARKYKDSPVFWGYDLANEPVESVGPPGLADWQELAERTAKAIREIDPHRTIVIEPAAWGGPEGLLELAPIDVPNVVYSVHMYKPHAFTHQNVHGPSPPLRYPAEIDGVYWDKQQLERTLQVVVDFQRDYNVHIYIGEFSAIRWAPDNSAYRYLKDLIEIFEQHGWDWTYHAFREWDGWSVEHGDDRRDRSRTTSPTDREQLLRSWFARNLKPAQTNGK